MSRRRHLGLLIYRWHSWAGLIGGLFLIFICLTGSLAVFKPELEQRLDWHGVGASHGTGPRVAPELAIAVAEASVPGSRAATIRLPTLPGGFYGHGDTYRVELALPKPALPTHVLVDPRSGTVVASAVYRDTWGYWLRQLHVRFLYGDFWGRWIVGGFGVVLLFATASGAWIYLRFNRRRWRPLLRRGRGARILLGDLHKLVGVASLAFMAMWGATGAVLGLEGLYRKYVPEPRAAIVKRAPLKALPVGTIDRAIAIAQRLIPDGAASAVTLANAASGTIRVEVELPARSLVRDGASGVLFDARTLEAIEVVDARQAPAGSRVYDAIEPLHFGRFDGSIVAKLTWAAMGASGGGLAVSGFAIYVLRNRPRGPAASATIVA